MNKVSFQMVKKTSETFLPGFGLPFFVGFYLLSDVPSGDFTITATYQNYFDFNGFITIARNVLPGGVGDVSLVPKIGVGQWRATLTWYVCLSVFPSVYLVCEMLTLL